MLRRSAPSRKESNEGYLDGETFIIPQGVAGPFLLKALPTLISDFTLLGTDRLREYKVSPVRPRLSMKFTSGIDFLEGEATVEVGDEKISLGDLFEQYRRDRYMTLRDGSRAVLDESYMKRLERIFGDRRDAGRRMRISFLDIPDIEDLLNERIDSEVFRHEREVYEGFNRLADARLEVPGLRAELRPYQTEGVKWIRYLYDNGLGGCLADDMGLGKTIQTIAMLCTISPQTPEPTLIVMPRSLLFNWQNELTRFSPQLSTYIYYQADRDIDEACRHDIILTTYAMVRNDIEKFADREFHYVILDESQNIKNIEAQVTRAVYMLRARHRLALS
ncbi:MAG: DEAD/DEAH box helicase, partial [Duncaniella sp.]|nr:DEAD/DEAH box helicase [Duncaniella sp.]